MASGSPRALPVKTCISITPFSVVQESLRRQQGGLRLPQAGRVHYQWFASGSSLQSLDYLTVAELVLKEWKEAGILEEYRTAFLKMLVMGVRNIRKYAPHAVQKEVTRKVADMLCQENLYRPGEDDSSLSRREGKLLKTWMGGKSGLDFSYYWKKIRKAGARLLRR